MFRKTTHLEGKLIFNKSASAIKFEMQIFLVNEARTIGHSYATNKNPQQNKH